MLLRVPVGRPLVGKIGQAVPRMEAAEGEPLNAGPLARPIGQVRRYPALAPQLPAAWWWWLTAGCWGRTSPFCPPRWPS